MDRSEILTAMSTLKLHGMKTAYDEIITTAVKRQHEPPRVVGDLLNAEISEKQARSIKYQTTIAKLPFAKEIEEFGSIGAESFGGTVEIQPVAGLILHLGGQDGLPTKRRGSCDPRTLRLHADDLGVGVLSDLTNERLAVIIGHPVVAFDALICFDHRIELFLVSNHDDSPSPRHATMVRRS